MNIIERVRVFAKSLQDVANRSIWDWRRCPKCGDTDTLKYGTYSCHPWCLDGRRDVTVQRHKCNPCSHKVGKIATYSETSALRVRGSQRELRSRFGMLAKSMAEGEPSADG